MACHLLISREYPPASYAPGGIGTYAANIARLMAGAGETVHVIAERWAGARSARDVQMDGRLIVHRVDIDDAHTDRALARLIGGAPYPAKAFAWRAGLLAESLVNDAGIDVIEAQEWEAPLYFFLTRRALGLGPARQPPCIVHLHSPTELIYENNEWSVGDPDYSPMVRMEEFCIRSADALLCPSRYLAHQVETRYGADAPLAEITVIPYPVGDFPVVPRDAAVWESERVAYIGRLEPRKGLIEFVDGAVNVARARPAAHFEFVGDDVWYRGNETVRRYMEGRIPPELKGRFRFLGRQPRHKLPAILARARAVVVPSRWENFPNTCIEAMRSGTPVIASPNGGMAEMLHDGKTGWIAPSQSAEGLAVALRRALATPARECENMGRAAAAAVQSMCDNGRTTQRHLQLRAEVARRGATRSRTLASARRATPAGMIALDSGRSGIGVVVCGAGGFGSSAAERSIAALRTPARGVAMIVESSSDADGVRAASEAAHLLIERDRVAGVAVIEASVALSPDFVDTCTAVLERDEEIGIVSGWMSAERGGFIRPSPSFPYQWLANDVAPASVFRSDALVRAGGLKHGRTLASARWNLANTILASGWHAVTVPAIIATDAEPRASADDEDDMAEMRARLRDQYQRDAAIVGYIQSAPRRARGPGLAEVIRLPLRTQAAMAMDAIRNPHRALRWLRLRFAGL